MTNVVALSACLGLGISVLIQAACQPQDEGEGGLQYLRKSRDKRLCTPERYDTDLVQRCTRPHLQIYSWLNNRSKKGVASVSLADIMKHTQGCTLTSKTDATHPPLAIIKPQANAKCYLY